MRHWDGFSEPRGQLVGGDLVETTEERVDELIHHAHQELALLRVLVEEGPQAPEEVLERLHARHVLEAQAPLEVVPHLHGVGEQAFQRPGAALDRIGPGTLALVHVRVDGVERRIDAFLAGELSSVEQLLVGAGHLVGGGLDPVQLEDRLLKLVIRDDAPQRLLNVPLFELGRGEHIVDAEAEPLRVLVSVHRLDVGRGPDRCAEGVAPQADVDESRSVLHHLGRGAWRQIGQLQQLVIGTRSGALAKLVLEQRAVALPKLRSTEKGADEAMGHADAAFHDADDAVDGFADKTEPGDRRAASNARQDRAQLAGRGLELPHLVVQLADELQHLVQGRRDLVQHGQGPAIRADVAH